MYKIKLLAVILLMLAGEAFAQSPTEKMSPELLTSDFKLFRETLEKQHAGLYRYRTRKEMDQVFKSSEALMGNGLSIVEYYELINHIISMIADGHTSASLPPAVNKGIITGGKMFPLMLHFIGSKAYITCDARGLIAGSEIRTIDGKSVNDLRRELFKHLPSDGSIESGKYAEMNYGDSPFFYLYYLVYGEKPDFKVEYIAPDGKKSTIVLVADLFRNMECRPSPPQIDKYLQLEYLQNDIAIITVKSFLEERLKGNNENFVDFLKTSFREINEKHIKKLIIDVRDNGGGNDNYGALLNSYLTDHTFKYFASIESNTHQFEKKEHEQLSPQLPSEYNFKGAVYILINGKCFSTTADFCAVAHNNDRVKFIGEETGGGYYGNTSGARTTLVLSNTQIKVNIPLWKYTNAVKPAKYKDRGTIPDYPLIPSISDVIGHKDTQMEYALKIVR